jgi:hypothetical protein
VAFISNTQDSLSSRYTKPLPKSVVEKVRYELFEGELTEEEEEIGS